MGELEERQRAFLEKHKPLSPEQVYSRIKESAEARENLSTKVDEVEKNLMNFLQTEEPLINPATGDAIAWIRHIPYQELKGMVPEEYMELKDDPEALKKKADEDEKLIYIWMEKMISKPEYTAEQWEQIATPLFIELFDARIREIFITTGGDIDFF